MHHQYLTYYVWQNGAIQESMFPPRYVADTIAKIFHQYDHRPNATLCKRIRYALTGQKEQFVFFHFWEDVCVRYRPCEICKPIDIFTKRDCMHMPFWPYEKEMRLWAEKVAFGAKNYIKLSCKLCGRILEGFAEQQQNTKNLLWREKQIYPQEYEYKVISLDEYRNKKEK